MMFVMIEPTRRPVTVGLSVAAARHGPTPHLTANHSFTLKSAYIRATIPTTRQHTTGELPMLTSRGYLWLRLREHLRFKPRAEFGPPGDQASNETSNVGHNLVLFAIWALIMWLGITAIGDAHFKYDGQAEVLATCVLVTAFAVVGLVHHLWKVHRNSD
jgi:hypothetical protein